MRDQSELGRVRYFSVYNVTASEFDNANVIPAWGTMVVFDGEWNDNALNVRPALPIDIGSDGPFLVNGPTDLEVGSFGTATVDWPARVCNQPKQSLPKLLPENFREIMSNPRWAFRRYRSFVGSIVQTVIGAAPDVLLPRLGRPTILGTIPQARLHFGTFSTWTPNNLIVNMHNVTIPKKTAVTCAPIRAINRPYSHCFTVIQHDSQAYDDPANPPDPAKCS